MAAALAAGGARIAAIVGTSEASVESARQDLKQRFGLECATFTVLQDALDTVRPTAVALCSPWRVHAEQLAQVAANHCHCLVEKPLLWPATWAAAERAIEAFETRGLLLDMITQWPATLPGWEVLHGARPRHIESFHMRLSPLTLDDKAIPDAAPHFISLLQALLGTGDCEEVFRERDRDELTVSCRYRHRSGSSRARLQLRACPERPRPAWYQINALRADREVDLPEYRQWLVAGGQRAALADPLEVVAAEFLRKLAAGEGTDGQALRAAHRNLLQLAG